MLQIILGVMIGNLVYQALMFGVQTSLVYLLQRKYKKLQAKYKKELEAKGIRVIETAEEAQNLLKQLNKQHLSIVSDDDSKDPKNNN